MTLWDRLDASGDLLLTKTVRGTFGEPIAYDKIRMHWVRAPSRKPRRDPPYPPRRGQPGEELVSAFPLPAFDPLVE